MKQTLLKRKRSKAETYVVREPRDDFEKYTEEFVEVEIDDQEALLAAQRKAEEEARIQREKAKAIEEARLQAEKAKAEEEARLQAEKAKAEEEARLQAEKAKAIEEARLQAEKAKAIEEARLQAEKAKAEEEARLQAQKQLEELKRAEVKATEVKEIVTDEVATALIEKEDETEKVYGNKKGIINLDVISKNFEAGDTVTVNTLKEKKLIDKNICFIKVLARGVLDKPLTVKAHDFSIDAAKMIELTGGKVVMLTKRKFFN